MTARNGTTPSSEPRLSHDRVWHDDCLNTMRNLPDASVDLIVTSPPYADQRKHTYGGIDPDEYVAWFAPRAVEMRRILTPTGSFVLNIKEKVVDCQRHPYVLELILHLTRETGFLWIEEYLWHKTTAMPGKWRHRFRDQWERLLHFTVSKDFKMTQDAVMVPVSDASRKEAERYRAKGRSENQTGSGFGRHREAWKDRRFQLPVERPASIADSVQ